MMRVRRLSPGEVWRAGCKELVRLQHEHVPLLLGPDLAEIKRMDKHHCFVVQGQEYGGGDELRFQSARIRNALGHDVVLDQDRAYKVFANPFDTSMLFVCDMDMRYIGVARRQVAVSRADLDEIHKAIGKVAHQRVAMDAPIRARHAIEAVERQEMIAHNEAVFATITGGVGPQKVGEKVLARRIKQADDATMGEMSELPVVAGVETPAANIDDML
jgi:hypothetical protein